jgi:hypothetical protein
MLPLGQLRVFGPPTGPRNSPSRYTDPEKVTLMTLWCISRSPLMFGGHLPETDPYTLSLITNAEVLAVNQNSANNEQVVGGRRTVWLADAPGSSDKYLAVFNRTTDAQTPTEVRLSDLGVGRARVRDLWLHQNLGPVEGIFAPILPAHGAGLYRLSAIESAPRTTPVPVDDPPAAAGRGRRGRGRRGGEPTVTPTPDARMIGGGRVDAPDSDRITIHPTVNGLDPA